MTPSDPVLAVLLRHHLVDDEPDPWMTGRIAEAYTTRLDGTDPVEAVADQLDREALGTARSEVVQEAARAVVDVLRGEL